MPSIPRGPAVPDIFVPSAIPGMSAPFAVSALSAAPFIPGISLIPSMPSIPRGPAVPDIFVPFVIPGMSVPSAIPGMLAPLAMSGMPASSAMPALSAVPFIPGISSAPSAPVVVPFSICIPCIPGSGMFMARSGSETFHKSVPATDMSLRPSVPGFPFAASGPKPPPRPSVPGFSFPTFCPALSTCRSFPVSPMPPPFAGSLIFAESFCFPVPLFCTGMCRVARPRAK